MSTPLAKYEKRQRQKFQKYIEENIRELTQMSWYWWISRVPLIDVDFILKFKAKSWSSCFISQNEGISKQDKINSRHLIHWDLSYIVDTMEEYVEWGLTCVSSISKRDKNIVADVYNYPEFPWVWYSIARNPYITEQFILDNYGLLQHHMDELSANPAVSIDFVVRTEHKIKWNKLGLSLNPNLTGENFRLVFSESDLTDEQFWSQKTIIDNLSERLSLDFVLSHPEIPWNTDLVCFRNDIKKEHIVTYPGFPWVWEAVSSCHSIDKNWIVEHPKAVLENVYRYNWTLTVDEVLHLPPAFIEGNLLMGTFEDKTEFLRNYYAVRKIEKAFHDCYWFVEYEFCRKRMNKRYDELFGKDE
jgi:hypothetical protein